MPYVDKVTVDNTTYDIRDTTTAQEVSDLLSFVWSTDTYYISLIPSNVDLDDYMGTVVTQDSKAGLYKINTTALANSIENIPEATAGLLICQNLSQWDRNLQIYITSASQHIYYRFHTNRGWQTWKQAASLDDLAAIKTEIETSINNSLAVRENISAIFRGQPFYSHAFLGDADSADSANNAVIPSESIYDIEVSRRLGFKVIEANLNATSDGEYIVIHGVNDGTWGYEVSDKNGNDISSTLISANTLAWVKENVRYRSKYQKFRTAPLEFKEWLKACRMNNMVPFFRFREAQNIIDADNIMGKYNYIVYHATRNDTDACISYYTTAYDNADDFIAAFDAWTPPLIISCGNWSSWTDNDITRVVNWAHHEKGFLIGCAGNYLSQYRVQKYWHMGFDMISSTSNIGAISHGNLSNDSSDVDFSAFNTTGTVQSDGSLLLEPGQYIESIDTGIQSVFLGGATLFFRASGDVNVYMYSKYMSTFGITAAEETENQVSTLYIEQVPRFRIANPSTATSNVIIYSIDFRRSKL